MRWACIYQRDPFEIIDKSVVDDMRASFKNTVPEKPQQVKLHCKDGAVGRSRACSATRRRQPRRSPPSRGVLRSSSSRRS